MAPRLRFKKIDVKQLFMNKVELPQSVVDELALLDGLTATVTELNKLDGATVTVDEINNLDLSVVGAVHKVAKFAIAAAPDGTEQDTTIVLPAKAIVKSAWLDVTAAEATGTTKTMDVGTKDVSNDPNGFIAALSVAATGIKRGTLSSAGQTLGALLYVDESGAGVLVPEDDITSFGATITFTAGSTDWVEFRGTLYVEYIEMG